MIKNLLYSLFLHFFFLLVIYSSFSTPEFDENKANEIAVSLITISGTQDSNILKPLEKPVDITKEKEEKKPKKQKEPKPKTAKPKEIKSLNQPNPEEKNSLPDIAEVEKPKEPESKEEITEEENAEEETQTESDSEESNEEETANTLASLDLSAREKFNIQSQLKMCYNRAVNETELESDIKISLKVQISTEGYITSDIESIVDEQRYNNPKETDYKIAIDNARRALDLCSPLRNLPIDKYDIWKEVLLEFGGAD